MATDRYAGQHGSSSPEALSAFEQAVEAVAAHRPGSSSALQQCLAADPDMVAAHALSGLGAVTLARKECVRSGIAQLEAARAATRRQGATTGFERALVAALEHSVDGRTGEAVAALESTLAQEPRALLLAKLSHGLRFLVGDLRGMLASTGSLLQHWDIDVPGYGFLLGCHAFGLEEAGDYAEAERAGRRAVLLEPRDAWGMHAVAHVYEMQGRTKAGIGWLTNARSSWQDCHNFRFHMAWHLGLFLLEEGRIDEVLALYDEAVRPDPTDDVRDVANATSLLWRLRQEGIAVGGRWDELVEIARKRRTETTLIFATLHQLLALVAAGERASVDDLVDALATEAATGAGDQASVAGRVGLPLARLITRDGSRPSSGVVLDLARHLPDLGGSNAQRDVFLRTLIGRVAEAGDLDLLQRLFDLRHQLRCLDRFAANTTPIDNERRTPLVHN